MPRYAYWFTNERTGRKNKGVVRAFDEESLREQLAADDILPTDIEVLPDDLATEPQKQLLVDHGVPFPAGVTKLEASDLISNLFEHRDVADETDFEIAEIFSVEVSRYASKATIYRAVLQELLQGEDPDYLGAWYAYRVYRNAFDRRNGGLRDPQDNHFLAIGSDITRDQRLLASLRRAAARSQVHFRYFGRIVTPDGFELQGDGDRSEVYEFALGQLFERGLLDGARRPEARYIGGRQSRSANRVSTRTGVSASPPVEPDSQGKPGCLANGLATLGAVAWLGLGWWLVFG